MKKLPSTTYIISFVVFFVVALVFITATRGSFLSNIKDARHSEETSQLTIETGAMPVLYPHEHKIEDSVSDPSHHLWVSSDILTIEEDLWVTRFELVLKNAAPQVLHHAGIIIPDKPNQICPNASYGEEVYAVGSADVLKPIAFSEPYGLFLSKGTHLSLEVMYHNPLPPFGSGEIYKNISAAVVMDIEKASRGSAKKPVQYYRTHIEDDPCPEGGVHNEVFTIPIGEENFIKKSRQEGKPDPSYYTFSRPGTIVYMGAHFHPWEGQKKLEAFLNEQRVSTFLPTHTSSEEWSWFIEHSRTSIPVSAGDVLSLSTTNSNLNSVPIIGAMGMIVFYFSPDE